MTDIIVTNNGVSRTLSSFGVCLLDGSYRSLFEFPKGKTPVFNDWHEKHGLDVDMSSFSVDTRIVSLIFCSKTGDMRDFLMFISTKPYTAFKVSNIEFILRFQSVRNFETIQGMAIYTLSFIEDSFVPSYAGRYIFSINQSPDFNNQCYLNSTNLANIGVRLLDGSHSEIIKHSSAKQNLTRTFDRKNGAIYDNSRVVFKEKDVSLSLLSTHLDNYLVLFNVLTRPIISRIVYGIKSYRVFYKSAKIDDIIVGPNNDFWCKFNLTLCFYDGYFF